MPQDPESQRSTREIAEQQARKSALTMAGSIVRVATELMIMGLGVGDESAIEVLGTAPLITMLLPLVLSHIGPVATSDPRVCMESMDLCCTIACLFCLCFGENCSFPCLVTETGRTV